MGDLPEFPVCMVFKSQAQYLNNKQIIMPLLNIY
jgi:hypothetical protein